MTSLAHNTGYTFTAYRGDNCAASNEIADTIVNTPANSFTATNIWANRATLKYEGEHASSWHYKRILPNPTGAQCLTGSGSGVITVGNLNAGTTYQFTAYSENLCSTSAAIANATVDFTTPASLTASNITKTSATLTIAGVTLGPLEDDLAAWYYKRKAPPSRTCSSRERRKLLRQRERLKPRHVLHLQGVQRRRLLRRQ